MHRYIALLICGVLCAAEPTPRIASDLLARFWRVEALQQAERRKADALDGEREAIMQEIRQACGAAPIVADKQGNPTCGPIAPTEPAKEK